MICESCKEFMCFTKFSKTIDGYIWTCNEHVKKTSSISQIIQLFFKMRKSFKDIFLFVYYWSNKTLQSRIGQELNLNKNNISKWCYFKRETCQIMFEFSNVKLGGIHDNGMLRQSKQMSRYFSKENIIEKD